MANEITKQELTPTAWSMIQAVALSAKDSGKLNLFKPEEAAIKMLMAWENGFPLTAAFSIVHVINNVPSLSPKAVWSKVMLHPEFGSYQEERLVDDKGKFTGYRITLKRKNGVTASRQFTLSDAKKAKLDQKDNWQMYEENMCYWRAMGFTEDVVYPDVTLGIVRADDLGALVNEDGDVIDAEWTVAPLVSNGAAKTTTQPAAPTPAVMLNTLINRHGADAVLAACGNALPDTVEGVEALTEKLMATILPSLDDVEEVNPNP